jgi:hypothetical protein
MPIILVTWEAEIKRIAVQGQLRQTVRETPISKITRAKLTGGVAQAVQHCFVSICFASVKPCKPQSHQKKVF